VSSCTGIIVLFCAIIGKTAPPSPDLTDYRRKLAELFSAAAQPSVR
jgi:hypothetical protein